jgi:peptide/nickel transport system permease protein
MSNRYNKSAAKGKLLLDHLIDFWKRFKQNKPSVVGLIIIIFFALIALLAPKISPYPPFKINFNMKFLPPNSEYLMGTDNFGRDILSRIFWGARVSLFIGFVSTGISVLVGVVLGSIAGYIGGKTDEIIMRIVEVFMMLPTFFLVLIIVFVFGSSIWNVMVVLGLTMWPGTARLMRAEFLSFKERDFVQAAKVLGASNLTIIFSEILPNAIFPVIVNSSMQIAGAIMTEASLSFLGLGDPNNVSWGWMLNDALKSFRSGWWMAVFPGLAITITVISFNLIGDGLNDALNPQLKER